jgi:biopolymer transport protein ExbD
VAVDPQGHYSINRTPVTFAGPTAFSAELRRAAGDLKDPVIVISADANSPHQSVINVMESARLAGYGKITFTTQAGKK